MYAKRRKVRFEEKSMRALFALAVALWPTWGFAQVVEKKMMPQVKNVVIEEGAVTPVYLRPGYTTSVRLPEEVNSVVVGNPLAFKAEHSEAEPQLVFIKPITTKAAESNALITTKSSQEINLHLISSGVAGASSQVDFLVEFNRPHSLLVGKTGTSSLFVPETKSTGSLPSAQNQPVRELVDPIAAALGVQKAIAAPFWQGSSLQVSVGESSEVDHQMLLGFSVLNNSRKAIELLPPQIVLNGLSASGKGKEIKAEPIAITDYKVTKKRLDPGERADGVVVFERPTFKESTERIELQVAESGKVDRPVRIAIPFVSTTAGGINEPK
jgi:hypothetical protein